MVRYFFFFNDTATTEIYTLSLHDALPICLPSAADNRPLRFDEVMERLNQVVFLSATPADYELKDRKSTRLNSSHANISYAVFCLKKKRSAGLDPCRTSRHGPRRPGPSLRL